MLGRRQCRSSWERLPRARCAAAFAERRHAEQRRSDGTPFIQHPREVATLLYQAGAAEHVIVAGLLHDVIEKAAVNASELRTQFGSQITRLVLAVSDDDRIENYAARKAALRHQVADAGEEALTVFAADKLSKFRELERETTINPRARVRSRARRLQHYQRSLALLQDRLPESPLVHDLEDELGSFMRARATTAPDMAPSTGSSFSTASHD